MSFEIKGTSDIDRFTFEFGKSALEPILQAAKAKLSVAARTAKTLAPVRTGALRKHIKVKVKRYRRGEGGGLYVGLGVESVWLKDAKGRSINPAKYAHLVEMGTVRSAPRSFMRRALNSIGGIDGVDKSIRKETKAFVEKLAKENAEGAQIK